ncbi:hypothetical protein ACFLYU_05520 [Candidatus Dependentiae bacterium]
MLKSPKPIVRLQNFGPNGYDFLIRGFLSSHYTLDMWDIESDIRLAPTKELREHNINIAIPIFSPEKGKLEVTQERAQTLE